MTEPLVTDRETLAKALFGLFVWEPPRDMGSDEWFGMLADALIASGAVVPAAAHREQVAREALEDEATMFETCMVDAWGEDSSWLTTGRKVAELVAGILREDADALTPKGPADE